MTMNNDNRHRCKTCEKFINKKLFLNKDGFCLKCFYIFHAHAITLTLWGLYFRVNMI